MQQIYERKDKHHITATHLAKRQDNAVPRHLEKPRDFDPFGQTGFAHLWLQYD